MIVLTGKKPKEEGAQVQQPTVGRIVHYQAYGTPGGEYPSVPRAAIVTQVLVETPLMGGSEVGDDEPEAVFKGKVGLAILNPTGMFFNPSVPYSEEPKPGCWSWPPRV